MVIIELLLLQYFLVCFADYYTSISFLFDFNILRSPFISAHWCLVFAILWCTHYIRRLPHQCTMICCGYCPRFISHCIVVPSQLLPSFVVSLVNVSPWWPLQQNIVSFVWSCQCLSWTEIAQFARSSSGKLYALTSSSLRGGVADLEMPACWKHSINVVLDLTALQFSSRMVIIDRCHQADAFVMVDACAFIPPIVTCCFCLLKRGIILSFSRKDRKSIKG